MLDPEKEKRRWKPAFFCALEIDRGLGHPPKVSDFDHKVDRDVPIAMARVKYRAEA
jgi:hypothetical protein